ncbi:hypothetical protein MJM99_35275, partial [Salmonella enterica subsp. enterica serovar Kentucky]|nr:hypothetical protein [Salmonella enterica subsp. enterica serovar Kentucky]
AVLQLAVKTAAVMLLMPRVIKPIMDGLTPIAKHARKRLQAKFDLTRLRLTPSFPSLYLYKRSRTAGSLPGNPGKPRHSLTVNH